MCIRLGTLDLHPHHLWSMPHLCLGAGRGGGGFGASDKQDDIPPPEQNRNTVQIEHGLWRKQGFTPLICTFFFCWPSLLRANGPCPTMANWKTGANFNKYAHNPPKGIVVVTRGRGEKLRKNCHYQQIFVDCYPPTLNTCIPRLLLLRSRSVMVLLLIKPCDRSPASDGNRKSAFLTIVPMQSTYWI